MAMNGWADPEPAWWLNLQADPDVMVELKDGARAIHARAAGPDERARPWVRWAYMPAGFFISVLTPEATAPNALIGLVVAGLLLVGGVLAVGLGLLRMPGAVPGHELPGGH
jgi:hypothetical protein